MVAYNYFDSSPQRPVWTIGTLARTMWKDSAVFGTPHATEYDASTDTSFDVVGNTEGRTSYYEHETGVDQNRNGTITAITANITSGDFDITQDQRQGVTLRGDGEYMMRVSRFIPDFLSQAGYLDKKVENSVLDKRIRDSFTQIWTIFFEFQIPTIVGWKKFFGDIETWAIWAQCAYNQNLVMNKGFKENISPELTSDNFVEKINNWGNKGLNAMTISELSGIPRPTALRKLNNLLKRKLLKKDKNNLYLLFGLPKLDTNTIEKDVTLKTVRDINKTNEERFIRMLTKILNTIVFN